MALMMFKLFVVSITVNVVKTQILTFPRCNANSLSMSFVYANPAQNPYDLFAVGRNNTCGKRARTATGSGTYADPYVLTVDLSRGVGLQSPDCGVQQTGATNYRLTVRAVFLATGSTANDTDYTVDCDNLQSPAATTTTTPPQVGRSASYACQGPSVIRFAYSHTALSAPYDVYAAGRQTTCSRSGGQGSGSGLAADPFVLSIDVSDPINICGVTLLGADTYSVLMYVQQLADVITVADASYLLTCNFTAVSNQVISAATLPAGSKIPIREASISQPTASLSVLSSPGGNIQTSFTVGDDIRLAAQFTNGTATGLRVRQCTVSPGPGQTPQISILDANGCSTANNLVSPFVGQSPSGALALTGIFDAFKLAKYDTVYFQCLADFCYTPSDVRCLGTHCSVSAGRRRRDAGLLNTSSTSDVITAYVTVRAEAGIRTAVDLPTTHQTIEDSSKNNNCHSFTKSDVIVVASLASTLAAAVLVSLGLALRLRHVMSLSDLSTTDRQPSDQNQCEIFSKPVANTPSWGHKVYGERGLRY